MCFHMVIGIALSLPTAPDGRNVAGYRDSLKCKDGVLTLAFRPDGKSIAAGMKDGDVSLWDVDIKKENGILRGSDDSYIVHAVSFSHNGNVLAVGGTDMNIRIWDLATRKIRLVLRGHMSGIKSLSVSREGKLASAAGDWTAKVWDLSNGKDIATYELDVPVVTAVAFSPDGRTVATATTRDVGLGEKGDATIQLWDVASGKNFAVFRGHTDHILCLAFHPKGHLLASGQSGKRGANPAQIKIWDLRNGKHLINIFGHDDKILSLQFSPDGGILASGSADKSVRLWKTTSGKGLAVLRRHTGPVHSVSFSPNGLILASGSADANIVLWNISRPPVDKQP